MEAEKNTVKMSKAGKKHQFAKFDCIRKATLPYTTTAAAGLPERDSQVAITTRPGSMHHLVEFDLRSHKAMISKVFLIDRSIS
ncbi:hypothetical protein [Salinicola endophyticus]|uniref:Uncharacterized protein n=1 Tax=Salinicola endophyticus TaxID=1949083 RepID=A0AB74UEI2_9GAMM